MKRTLLLIFIIILLEPQSLFCDVDNARLYNRANDHYTKKEYHEALELYLELVERGVQNPSLFYNLANTYYNIGMSGHAVLYYERALLLEPFDRDIRSNLSYVNRNLEDKIRPLYDEGIFRLFRILFSYIKIKITVITELIGFTVMIALFLCFLFLPNTRQKFKKPLIAVTVLYLFALIGMISQNSNAKRHPKGIILQKVLEVKSSPLSESETIFTIHEGTKFKLIEKRGEWIRFSIADGRQGWILQETTALIDSDIILQ